MTLSTPFKIIATSFAIAALVATAMIGSGSESAGLKGSRKLYVFDDPGKRMSGSNLFSFSTPEETTHPTGGSNIFSSSPPGAGASVVDSSNLNALLSLPDLTVPSGAAASTPSTLTTNSFSPSFGQTQTNGVISANADFTNPDSTSTASGTIRFRDTQVANSLTFATGASATP